MSQHGPTMSPDLIYLPFWKRKQGWEQDRAEYEERERRRQERKILRLRSQISRRWGDAYLKDLDEKIAYDKEMHARNAVYAKRRQAVIQGMKKPVAGEP